MNRIPKKHWLLFYATCLFIGILFFVEWPIHNRMKVTVLDVGQGDAILIRTREGKNILIDAGPPDGSVVTALGKEMKFFDKTIDLFILTHPHLDHFGGFWDVNQHYDIKKVLLSGALTNDAVYREFLRTTENMKVPIALANQSIDWRIGPDTVLDVLYPLKNQNYSAKIITHPNNASVAVRLTRLHKGALEPLMLLTGDAEKREEGELLMSGQNFKSPVLKLGHHGSRTSSTQTFLNAIKPHEVTISYGKDNSFKHPHQETLEKVKNLKVRETAKEGNIVFWF